MFALAASFLWMRVCWWTIHESPSSIITGRSTWRVQTGQTILRWAFSTDVGLIHDWYTRLLSFIKALTRCPFGQFLAFLLHFLTENVVQEVACNRENLTHFEISGHGGISDKFTFHYLDCRFADIGNPIFPQVLGSFNETSWHKNIHKPVASKRYKGVVSSSAFACKTAGSNLLRIQEICFLAYCLVESFMRSTASRKRRSDGEVRYASNSLYPEQHRKALSNVGRDIAHQ